MPSLKLGQRSDSDPEGRMPLMEHIRELRNRIAKVLVALLLAMVVGWLFYEPFGIKLFGLELRTPGVLDFLQRPYCEARAGDDCQLYLFGAIEPFTFRLKVAFILGLVVSSPVWVYQLWAFVTPGLHRHERRYTLTFVGLGVPFFLGGVALAYIVIDRGLSLFVGLLSSGMELNLKAGQYLTFLTVIMLIFGISFELPLLVTMLNFAGVLSYEQLKAWRRWIVFGVCVFAAVATPSQDPFTMLALAIPMALLMELATLIAKFNDRRREREAPYGGLSDDETSSLDLDDSYDTDRETR